MKTLLFLLSFTVICSLSAVTSSTDNPVQKTQAKDVKPVKFDVRAYGAEVDAQMDQLMAKLKKGKLEGIEMLAYSKMFEAYSKHPEIEKATKIYRQFFEKTARYLKGMSTCKSTIETMEIYNKLNDPRYIEAKKLYDPAIKNFLAFFEDPPHIKK